MKTLLRLFRYCRKRIITLSVENKMLKNENRALLNHIENMENDLIFYEQANEYKYINTKH